jgi:hypothetical protein
MAALVKRNLKRISPEVERWLNSLTLVVFLFQLNSPAKVLNSRNSSSDVSEPMLHL